MDVNLKHNLQNFELLENIETNAVNAWMKK